MAYTKDQFIAAIAATVAEYPAVAARYKVGDPQIIQAQSAMAQMLAMVSQQIELAASEPFDKARDSTVLADASLKGLVPMGSPARVGVTVKNNSLATFILGAGRVLFDSSGISYVVDTPTTIFAGTTATVEVVQHTQTVIQHTVSGSQPFYEIEVPEPDDGTYISGIAVQDAAANQFAYRAEFTNIGNGERVFHVEADEYRRLFVRFGFGGVVGYQPVNGEVIQLTVSHTAGPVNPQSGSPFQFEYTYTPQDGQIDIKMATLLMQGSTPLDIATLRELCKYPSIYDENAVFLGEFSSLVRRKIPNIRFLSIWSETIEEQVRGASVNNINVLFISFIPPFGTSSTITQAQIAAIIALADDSYEPRFIAPVILPIGITVAASVARINDTNAVAAQISAALIDAFGQDAVAAQSGMLIPSNKTVNKLLKEKIPALQDDGSDYSVVIAPPPITLLPEQYRYVTAGSLSITVVPADYNLGQWGR